jgi:exosome complex RNA-binding protein Csl4
MLDKTDNYSLSIRRCKEGLVLRKIIELDCINLGTNETTVRKVAKMYKSVNNRI